jgi:hypothetical protein
MLVPAGNAGTLESALDRLMGDDGLRAAFARRATEVRERFSMPKISGMWEALFAHHCALRRTGGDAVAQAGHHRDIAVPDPVEKR